MFSFRLVTSIQSVGIDEPTVVSPEIEEPILFSDAKITGKSDPKYHGFNHNFSDGELKLEFTCESGLSLITQQYYTYGSDVDIRFQVIFTPITGPEVIDYDGKLDGATISIEPGKVKASILQKGIEELVTARWDSPIAMDSWQTLDGKMVTPPSYVDLALPGQALRQKLDINNTDKVIFAPDTLITEGFPAILVSIIPPTETTTKPTNTTATETIQGFSPSIGGMFGDSPEVNGVHLLKAPANGAYAISFHWLFRVDATLIKKTLDIGASKFVNWYIEPFLLVVKTDGTKVQTSLAAPQSGDGEKTYMGKRDVDAHYNDTLTLEKDDKVYFYAFLRIVAQREQKRIEVTVTNFQVSLSISALTKADPSTAKVWFLPDAIRHVLRCITNQSNLDVGAVDPIISTLLDGGDPLGYAAEYVVTNGASLRGVPKAPTFSLKDLMGVLQAHHAAGLQYVGNQVQIEQGDWFYQDTEIVKMDTVFEYREEVATEHLYNQIEAGYEKFPDDGPGVREEFNTTRTYQTPLVNHNAKLEIKCPLIGAGTSIEDVRTVQFLDNPTDSHSLDDAGFLLHVIPTNYSNLAKYSTIPIQEWPNPPYEQKIAYFLFPQNPIKVGGSMTVLSGAGAGATILITAILGRTITNGIKVSYSLVSGTIADSAVFSTITYSSGSEPFKLRHDERLDVTGLSDPSTVLNLELSPARMIRRHAPFLLNGLKYKPLASELRCTFFTQNGDMTTQVKPASAPLPGDPFKQQMKESGPVALGELDIQGRLFSPEWVYAIGWMPREDIKLLLAARANSEDAPVEKRRGYVSVLNPDGTYTGGWIGMGGILTYNPCSEVVEFKLLKRNPDPQTIVDCDKYRDWTFEQFVADPTADPNVYRFCRFLEFN